jgi:hypothetical protein
MGNWFMQIVAGLFSIWSDDGFDDDYWSDPLASVP